MGNRTAYTATLGTTTVTTYTYDAANRLTSVGGVAYTWDGRGNLTSDGVFTYTYNAAGRLVRAQSITATIAYTYTAEGLRVAQNANGTLTTYAWDWASPVPELLSDGDALYLVGLDTLGRQEGGEWAYVLPDGLGSVRQAVDGAGAVVSAREWSPFGVEVGAAQAGSTESAWGFTGEWYDANVGLEYLRARWYSPQVGIFPSPDPFPGLQAQPLSLNPYLYVLANPVNAADPSGRYGKDEVHFRLTLWWAEQLAVTYCASPICAMHSLQYWIAWGDKHMDDLPSPGYLQEFHFVSRDAAWEDIKFVPSPEGGANDPVLFGAALHELQDYWSHRYEGYTLGTGGHFGPNFGKLPRSWGTIAEFYAIGAKLTYTRASRDTTIGY